MLDQRRLHETVVVGAEVIDQRAPQLLNSLGLGRQNVLDVLGQYPVTHG